MCTHEIKKKKIKEKVCEITEVFISCLRAIWFCFWGSFILKHLFVFWSFLFLRRSYAALGGLKLAVNQRMTLNWFFCLYLPSGVIISMCRYAQPPNDFAIFTVNCFKLSELQSSCLGLLSVDCRHLRSCPAFHFQFEWESQRCFSCVSQWRCFCLELQLCNSFLLCFFTRSEVWQTRGTVWSSCPLS